MLIFLLIAASGLYFFSHTYILRRTRSILLPKEAAPHIYTALEGIIEKAHVPTPALYYCPDPQPNIFSVGRNALTTHIVLTRGVLETCTQEEIEALLAHEIGHITHKDIFLLTITATLATLLTWTISKALLIQDYTKEQKTHGNSLGGLLALIMTPLASAFVRFMTNSTTELKADFVAASYTRKPLALAHALEKIQLAVGANIPLLHQSIALGHLYAVFPFKENAFTSLFITHPPLSERIDRLNNMLV